MNESLRTADGRGVLRMERRLAHPPEKVWRALTEPAQLSRWFPADMAMELTEGAPITFTFRAGEAPNGTGVIRELDPPRVLAYSWDRDELRWEVHPHGDGSLLVLTHTFGDPSGAASFAAGWWVCLGALVAMLDDRPQEPVDIDAKHEDFMERLGLAAGTAEESPEGWRVRFERQLVRPAGVAWRALTGDRDVTVGEEVPKGATDPAFPAGPVTAADAPALLEYGWRHGLIRWELRDGDGTHQGARLVLTQTGPADRPADRDTALAVWRAHLTHLGGELARSRTQ